jgi:hypothetical protein
MPVKVKINKNWSGHIEQSINAALLEMATDIHRRAVTLAPVDTSALVNSGKVEPVMNGYRITFGSTRVPYARRQHFEHKTKSGYLSKAGDSVARGDKLKYFRGKI